MNINLHEKYLREFIQIQFIKKQRKEVIIGKENNPAVDLRESLFWNCEDKNRAKNERLSAEI